MTTPAKAKAIVAAHGAIYDARRRFVALRGGRSQRQLARDLGVSHWLVQRFEAGAAPGVTLLLALGLAGVRLDWLIFGQGPPSATKPRRDDFASVSLLDFEPWETVEL